MPEASLAIGVGKLPEESLAIVVVAALPEVMATDMAKLQEVSPATEMATLPATMATETAASSEETGTEGAALLERAALEVTLAERGATEEASSSEGMTTLKAVFPGHRAGPEAKGRADWMKSQRACSVPMRTLLLG